MSDRFFTVVMFLAYGPFLLMVCLYVAGLLLRIAGRPDLLTTLVERTKIPKPVVRAEKDEEH